MTEINPVPMKRWDFRLYNFYDNPFKCNWFNFPFIRIEPEWDRMLGEFSFKFELLGAGFEFTYTYDMTMKNEMMGQVDKMLEEYGLNKKDEE